MYAEMSVRGPHVAGAHRVVNIMQWSDESFQKDEYSLSPYMGRHKHDFYDRKTLTLIKFSCKLDKITINSLISNSREVSLRSPDSESSCTHHTSAVF